MYEHVAVFLLFRPVNSELILKPWRFWGLEFSVDIAGRSTGTTFHAKQPPVQIILRRSLHAPLIQAPWATGHHSHAWAGGGPAQASGHGRGHGDPVEPKLRRVWITWAFQI